MGRKNKKLFTDLKIKLPLGYERMDIFEEVDAGFSMDELQRLKKIKKEKQRKRDARKKYIGN